MKRIFPGFYSPSEKELDDAWKSDSTLFVFDTNTLLNLYGYASQTRDDFFIILDAVSQRIWIPYHVGLEYQKRRLSVVKDEKAVFNNVEELLLKIDKVFESDFSKLALDRRFPTLHTNTEKLRSDIKKLVSAYRKSVTHWDKKQPCVRGHDAIREKISSAFEGKTGIIPESQEYLNNIFKEGEIRYKNNAPPGYKDGGKSKSNNSRFIYAGFEYDRQYGDLIIWKQILEKSKDKAIKSVIFVTDDAKDDWWYILNSRGEKNIGPRAELREEICREGNIDLFSMYNTSSFLDSGKRLLEVDIKEESIDDANNAFYNRVKLGASLNSILSDENKNYNELLKAFEKSTEPLYRSNDWNQLGDHYESINNNTFKNIPNQFDSLKFSKMKALVLNKELEKFYRDSELTKLKDLLRKADDDDDEKDI